MNEDQTGARIRNLLNQGLSQLDAEKLRRLHAARERALTRHRVPRIELVPAWAGRLLGPLGPLAQASRWAVPAAFVVLALIGFQFWQSSQPDDLSDLDAAVLKGDLPIDAYLDQGFQSWLRRSGE